ncbi:MAG: ornithine carbamoyltransferase [Planctomycetota bacterium]|jgi:ornithine carbamoyltransferase|nr:ornithine carbamoyltransferase [Planctomycetota bacterium]
MKNLLSAVDLSAEEMNRILDESARMKERMRAGETDTPYAGKTLGMYFEKPSLRTRVSLEVAMHSLGGSAINLEAPAPGELWKRESIKDQARVMSRFVSVVSMRTYSQAAIEEFAREASVHVVNALSDFAHPTQALADFLTIREHCGGIAGKTVVFLGDGNNVARSLLAVAALGGARFVWCGPDSHRIDAPFVEKVVKKRPDADFDEESDPAEAVRDADIIYTDVWASMGMESEAEAREKTFMPYQVNARLLSRAPGRARVMHCLPAHRGSEITDEVMDSAKSIVYDQAENRMHLYRGLFSLWAGDWKA